MAVTLKAGSVAVEVCRARIRGSKMCDTRNCKQNVWCRLDECSLGLYFVQSGNTYGNMAKHFRRLHHIIASHGSKVCLPILFQSLL